MGRIEEELSAVVAEAIGRQLDDAPLGDESEDQRAQRLTSHQLVKDALAGGQFGAITVSDLHSFAGGNTAMLVARVNTTLTFVVKVDRSPSLVAEAHHLRSASTDPRLPEATRRAFPQIFAVDDVGPIYGYLMESLEDYATFASLLVDDDPAMRERVLEVAWNDVLAPAYLATRQKRVIPNVVEDYFVRAESRLCRAVERGLLPAPDAPIVIRSDGGAIEIPTGWGPQLDDARARLEQVAPPFSTFVHGDPNPENILWGRTDDGEPRVRLIDPKDWGHGDYLFDAAKIGHYLCVTSPVEHDDPPVEVSLAAATSIEYDREALTAHQKLESSLQTLVARTAEDHGLPDHERWRDRYELAMAANLLGIVGPRLERAADGGPATDFTLGWIAFAEGLRRLAASRDLTVMLAQHCRMATGRASTVPTPRSTPMTTGSPPKEWRAASLRSSEGTRRRLRGLPRRRCTCRAGRWLNASPGGKPVSNTWDERRTRVRATSTTGQSPS